MKKIVTILVILFSFYCKKAEQTPTESTYAVALFAMGKIHVGEKEFKTNSILKENETLVFEPKSICDLQVGKEEFVFRIKGSATFKLEHLARPNSKRDWKIHLTEGKFLANIPRTIKDNESFETITPTVVVGVRGTHFVVEVEKDGSSKIFVTEGKTAVSFPKSAFLKPEVFDKLEKFKGKAEIILEKGNVIPITKALIQMIESAPLDTEENVITLFLEIKNKFVIVLKPEEITSLENEFKEITPLPQTAFVDEPTLQKAVTQRIGQQIPALLNQMAKISQKKKGTLSLTNGEEIQGIIEQNGEMFIIETPLETKQLNSSQGMEVDYN